MDLNGQHLAVWQAIYFNLFDAWEWIKNKKSIFFPNFCSKKSTTVVYNHHHHHHKLDYSRMSKTTGGKVFCSGFEESTMKMTANGFIFTRQPNSFQKREFKFQLSGHAQMVVNKGSSFSSLPPSLSVCKSWPDIFI